MPSRCEAYREALYAQLARVSKALAHPGRLMILDLLQQAPRTVEALAAQVGMSVASTSQHLQVLRAARLVEADKRGLYVTYSLADQAVYDLMRDLRLVAQHRLAEVEQLQRQMQEQAGHLTRLSPADLQDCLRQGEVVLLDVRPLEEYQAAHLPGAVLIPLDQLEGRLAELPRARPIVAYCRGQYCLMARHAVDLLQQHGYVAQYVDEGLRELETAGVAVERDCHA